VLNKRLLFPLPVLLLMVGAAFWRPGEPAAAAPTATPQEKDRSPCDLVLLGDGRFALTANRTSDTVSLVDVEGGKLIAETPVGKQPFGVAAASDGRQAVVSNWLSDTISILHLPTGAAAPRVVATIAVGDEPRGVAVSPNGARAFVALGGEDAVAVVDLKTRTVANKWPVGREPWRLALSPDGKTLAVANTRGANVSVLDATTGRPRHMVRTNGLNLRSVAVSPDAKWAYVPFVSDRGFPVTEDNIDRGWVIGNRLARVPLAQNGPREAISLDPRGDALGDVDGLDVSPDGNTLVLTAAGTHELIVLHLPLRFVAYGGPGDFIDEDLRNDHERFRRIRLGGRPLGVKVTPGGERAIIANYLLNAVQVVDLASGAVTKTIALGGPAAPSLARKGEALFTDASRSFHSWFSCNTCHVEGHTNGGSFDTFNDKTYNVLKKTLSLRGVAQTPPYTWHGWQGTMRDSIHESALRSMRGPEPSEADLDALDAYFQTLDWAPSPHRKPDGGLTAQAKRGETLFSGKGCVACHAAPTFTTPAIYDVGLDTAEENLKGYNPPSLRNVSNRAPYLHDARAATLGEVVTKYHRPSHLSGKPDLKPAEVSDVVAYLKSL